MIICHFFVETSNFSILSLVHGIETFLFSITDSIKIILNPSWLNDNVMYSFPLILKMQEIYKEFVCLKNYGLTQCSYWVDILCDWCWYFIATCSMTMQFDEWYKLSFNFVVLKDYPRPRFEYIFIVLGFLF